MTVKMMMKRLNQTWGLKSCNSRRPMEILARIEMQYTAGAIIHDHFLIMTSCNGVRLSIGLPLPHSHMIVRPAW